MEAGGIRSIAVGSDRPGLLSLYDEHRFPISTNDWTSVELRLHTSKAII